ncbi:MAG: OsmC family protein [Spirochaetota bacterium]
MTSVRRRPRRSERFSNRPADSAVVVELRGFTAEAIDTEARVTLEKQGDGHAITQISLTTKADVPGIARDQFLAIAQKAKEGCPVSRALKAVPISLEAELVSE